LLKADHCPVINDELKKGYKLLEMVEAKALILAKYEKFD
jgi:hypothetical protein